MNVPDKQYSRGYREGWGRGRDDERARCIKVLADLRDDNRSQVGKQWLATAIAALSDAPTPPVASSPVGGERPPKRLKWWQTDPDYDDRGMEKDYR